MKWQLKLLWIRYFSLMEDFTVLLYSLKKQIKRK
jgi:hypothetical protein